MPSPREVLPPPPLFAPPLAFSGKAVAVPNSLLEKFSGKFRRCWKILHRFSGSMKMLSLPRFGHFPARKTAAGKLGAPAGTLLDFSPPRPPQPP